MALKSLVKADDEMVGVDEPLELVLEALDPPPELLLLLELLEFELPHPAATSAATASDVHTCNRPKLIPHAPLI
jgi:hypothetical protein